MPMHVKEQDIPPVEWDEDDLADLRKRLIAAGYKMPTKSLNRPRTLAKRRPRWIVFFISTYRYFLSLFRRDG